MNQNPTDQASVLYQVFDRQHNIVAASFEHPKDWQGHSDVIWNYQHVSAPLEVYAVAYNPNALEAVEMFPVESFFWLEPNYGFNQEGQNNLGQTCSRPMPAADAFMRWILPKYRGNRPNLRVIGVAGMPDLPQKLNVPVNTYPMVESVSVKVEYFENGRMIEEEFYAIKVEQQAPPSYGAAGMLIQTNWGFLKLFSFRAEKDGIEAKRQMFWQIIRSVKVNPQWEQICNNVVQQLAQQFNQYIQAGYDQINAATQMSRMISAQNDAWLNQQSQRRESDWQAWEHKRQQENEAWGKYNNNDAFGDMMMGRETWNDPSRQEGQAQVDGYHDYVWTNQQQEYIPTDDPNYNPNIGSNQNWVLLDKKKIGE